MRTLQQKWLSNEVLCVEMYSFHEFICQQYGIERVSVRRVTVRKSIDGTQRTTMRALRSYEQHTYDSFDKRSSLALTSHSSGECLCVVMNDDDNNNTFIVISKTILRRDCCDSGPTRVAYFRAALPHRLQVI